MKVKHNCSDCVHRKEGLMPCDWLKSQMTIVTDCPYYKKENPWKQINDAFSSLCDQKGGIITEKPAILPEPEEFIIPQGHMIKVFGLEDFLKVVRCKDCDNTCPGSNGLVCTAWGARTDPDGWCYKAERREGE